MRWLALSVLLANMLLAVWYFAIVRPVEQRQAAPALSTSETGTALPLLGELDDAARQDRGVVRVGSDKPRSRPVPAPQSCLLLGPVPEKVTARQLQERFAAIDLKPDFRLLDVPVAPVHVIFLPPYAEETEARDVLRRLRAAGIDSFYIPDGDLKGGISLGVYSQLGSAEKIRDERRSQGYPAELRVVARARQEIWVSFEAPGALADEAYWQSLSRDFPGLSRRPAACQAIAAAAPLF